MLYKRELLKYQKLKRIMFLADPDLKNESVKSKEYGRAQKESGRFPSVWLQELFRLITDCHQIYL